MNIPFSRTFTTHAKMQPYAIRFDFNLPLQKCVYVKENSLGLASANSAQYAFVYALQCETK